MSFSRNYSYLLDGVAVIWYSLLFGLAGRLRHAQSAVVGKDLWRGLDLYYHAMGGKLDRKVKDDPHMDNSTRISTHGGIDLQAWSEPGILHLPRRINRFPTRELNRELYYWLAAFLAVDEPCPGIEKLPPGVRHILQGISTTTRLIESFPALKSRYERLCAQELSQRRTAYPDPVSNARNRSLALESAIRAAIGSGSPCRDDSLNEMIEQARKSERVTPAPEWLGRTVPFLPVPIWSYRTAPISKLRLPWFRSTRKHQESNPLRSVAKAKFDPEFLPVQKENLPVIPDQFTYPEWNCFTNSYMNNWCRLTEQKPKGGYRVELDTQFSELVHRVQRRFQLLRQEPQWSRYLEDGEDLDIDAFVTSVGDRRGCGLQDSGFYREKVQQYRDMSVIVLMDASRSTEAWVDKFRVIDIAKQSLAVLAEVLDATGDEFALYSFSSDSRIRVRCDRIKTFEQSYDDAVLRSLLEVKPQNYTRLGPVVRHLGAKLHGRSSRQKLLLILSDGKPHDPTDRYEGRYALEDTRKALMEQRARNVECFGLTIDQQGPRYLNHLFGSGHYAVFSHLHSLPDLLPNLYARLTDLKIH